MEKEFIPSEQALALKELGFDEPCFARYYNSEPYNIQFFQPNYAKNFNEKQLLHNKEIVLYYSAPTFSQAFRWFREKYGYCHFINHSGEGYCSGWEDLGNNEHGFENYTTYEEAELECLKKLIEIVKK